VVGLALQVARNDWQNGGPDGSRVDLKGAMRENS
jgi:hypothetical protein